MSQHEIEDLAEDTVRLLLEADFPRERQLRLIRGVYRFHDIFDTSDTIGRLRPQLEAIGYFETEDAEPATLLETVAAALGLAAARGDRRLGHDWLAALVDAVDSFDLGDAIPKTFEAFSSAPETAAIRAAGRRLELASFKAPRNSHLRLPAWKRLAGGRMGLDACEMAKKHCLRLLVDLDADEETIAAGHEADAARIARFETSPLFRLPEILPEFGDFAFVGEEELKGAFVHSLTFMFEMGEPSPEPEASRRYLELRYDVRSGDFDAFVKFQSGLLNGWRKRDFGGRRDDMHFSDLIAAMEKYRFDQPEKALRKAIKAIVDKLPDAAKSIAFHARPLRKLLERNDFEQLLKKQDKLRLDHGFLTNDFDVFFAYACLSWEKGERPDALIQRIIERLPAVHDDYPLKGAWREGAEALKSGPWFPPLTERIRYRDLTKG